MSSLKRRRDFFEEMRDWFEESMVEPGGYRGILPAMREKFVSMFDPYFEVQETAKDIILTVELPGVAKEDIDISVSDNTIEVRVEKEEEKETKGESEYLYESRYRGFRNSYRTPVPIKTSGVDASFKNGVLQITAQKADTDKKKKVSLS